MDSRFIGQPTTRPDPSLAPGLYTGRTQVTPCGDRVISPISTRPDQDTYLLSRWDAPQDGNTPCLVALTGILLIWYAPHKTGLTPRLRLGSRLSGTVGVAQHRKRVPLGYSGAGIRNHAAHQDSPLL